MGDSRLYSLFFDTPEFGSANVLFVFGLFLIMGVLAAVIAHHFKRLPTITSFLLLGVAIGPGGFSLIDSELVEKSMIIVDVALGLILYKLGCEVQLRHMLRSTLLWRASVIEALATFGVVALVLQILGLPWLVSALIAAIAISSSPAVLVHMSEELEARGPVIHEAKALLTLNNVWSFLIFSVLFSFVLGAETFSLLDMILIPLYRATGAVLIGAVFAFIATYIDRWVNKEDEHFRFALVVGSITATMGLATMFHVSLLFAALTHGIITRWLETQRQGLSTVEMGASADIFFIVLFVMAGANLHLSDLAQVGGIALAVALARATGKIVALTFSRGATGLEGKAVVATGLMLTPMGALAIGLAGSLKMFSPGIATQVLPIVFAVVALLETMGPFAVDAAIRMTGESALYRREAAAVTPPEELPPSEPLLPEL
ncbi:MAG: cation:proton antiporter [Bdellovibrionales bacterium]